MIPRYTRPKIEKIWSPENKFTIWTEIECLIAEKLSINGVIPKKAAKEIRSKKDPSSISKLEAQLSKISSMGDLSNLVPSEGLVFKYNGKIYKFTGYFAPINQIPGLMKFSR